MNVLFFRTGNQVWMFLLRRTKLFNIVIELKIECSGCDKALKAKTRTNTSICVLKAYFYAVFRNWKKYLTIPTP